MGQPAIALTLATRARLRRRSHVGPPARRLQYRDARSGARQSARRDREWRDRNRRRQSRARRQAHRARRLPRKEGRRARRRLGDPGPDRLPHPSGFRRQPRRGACDAPRRRQLRGDRQGWRRNRLDRGRDQGRIGRGASRTEQASPPCADGAAAARPSRSSPAMRSTPRASCACSGSPGGLGEGEAVRIVPTLLALHALPADSKDRRAHYVGEIIDKLLPEVAKAKLASSVDAYCDTIGFTPTRSSACSRPRREHGLRVRLHAEQLSNQHGAELAAQYRALVGRSSRASRRGRSRGDGQAGTVAVLLPGAYLRAARTQSSRRSTCCASTRCRSRSRTDCNPGYVADALADPGNEHGVHLVRPDSGGGARRDDAQWRPRARDRSRTSAASLPARRRTFACGASNRSPSIGYWIGFPVPSGGFSADSTPRMARARGRDCGRTAGSKARRWRRSLRRVSRIAPGSSFHNRFRPSPSGDCRRTATDKRR